MDQFEKAVAAHRAGDFEAAERGYLAINQFARARHNLGVLYKQVGRFAEAEAAFRSVLHIPEAQHSLSLQLLFEERYAEAWPLYEARRRAIRTTTHEPIADYPEWFGEPIKSKRLVVCGEQGFGDQIMFARYLWPLRETGADITVACPSPMQSWFEAAGFPTVRFSQHNRTLPDADRWVLLCSLPLRLNISEPAPLVHIGPPRHGGGGIGIMPTGARRDANDKRSLGAAEAAALLTIGKDIRPEATGAGDFLQTANLVARLDRVVSVDTSVAHLAATMGVPTTVLVSRTSSDFRWLRSGDRSPWYPAVQMIRQNGDDWSDAVAQLITRCRLQLASRSVD